MCSLSADTRLGRSMCDCGPGEVRSDGVLGRWVLWASPVGDDSAEEGADEGWLTDGGKRPYTGEVGGDGEGDGVLL